jgi:hypothetical protein
MQKKLYNAIVFFPPNLGRQPAKYRNISNPASFARFALRSGASYVNWYDKETKEYINRSYVK